MATASPPTWACHLALWPCFPTHEMEWAALLDPTWLPPKRPEASSVPTSYPPEGGTEERSKRLSDTGGNTACAKPLRLLPPVLP